MSAFDFITYMENVAVKLKDIEHTTATPRYHKISSIAELEQLLQASVETEGIQLLVLDNKEGRLIDNDAAGLFDDKYFIFYLLQNITVSDMEERSTTLESLKATGKKILSKMFKDMLADGELPHANRIGLYDLDRDSIRYLTIGPLGDNYHGIQFSFTVADTFSYAYDSNDWNS